MKTMLLLGLLLTTGTGCMLHASVPGASLAVGVPPPPPAEVIVERPFYPRPWRPVGFYRRPWCRWHPCPPPRW